MRIKRTVATALGLVAAALMAIAGTSSADVQHYKPIKSPVRATVDQTGAVRPMVTDGNSFLEVNAAGELVYWTRSADGSTFVREVRGIGWQPARLITSLSHDRFVEIKDDGRLAEWNWVNGGYHQTIVGTGWQGSRAITGLDGDSFLEIKPDNVLALWKWVDDGYQETIVGAGWDTARLIAGMGSGYFLEIKTNGKLAEWYWDSDRNIRQYIHEDTNFNSVRLMVGTDLDHWVLVEDDGSLGEFVWDEDSASYVHHVRGTGWQPARLLG